MGEEKRLVKQGAASRDLLAYIREGREMTQGEKLRLITSLSIPSILAQISETKMVFIEPSKLG